MEDVVTIGRFSKEEFVARYDIGDTFSEDEIKFISKLNPIEEIVEQGPCFDYIRSHIKIGDRNFQISWYYGNDGRPDRYDTQPEETYPPKRIQVTEYKTVWEVKPRKNH